MKSKSKILLRTACVLIFVHLAGHFIGHTGWKRPTDPKMQEVVNAILFGVTYLAFGAVEFWLFFPFAAIISTLAGVTIVLSLFFNDNKQYKKDIKNENRKDY
jgi:hypothetical protein